MWLTRQRESSETNKKEDSKRWANKRDKKRPKEEKQLSRSWFFPVIHEARLCSPLLVLTPESESVHLFIYVRMCVYMDMSEHSWVCIIRVCVHPCARVWIWVCMCMSFSLKSFVCQPILSNRGGEKTQKDKVSLCCSPSNLQIEIQVFPWQHTFLPPVWIAIQISQMLKWKYKRL